MYCFLSRLVDGLLFALSLSTLAVVLFGNVALQIDARSGALACAALLAALTVVRPWISDKAVMEMLQKHSELP